MNVTRRNNARARVAAFQAKRDRGVWLSLPELRAEARARTIAEGRA